MMNELILFMIRKKLKLKKMQEFCFINKKNNKESYFFSDDAIMKKSLFPNGMPYIRKSSISLNFILSKEAGILILRKKQ